MELYAASRKEWREWLDRNHALSDGVWLMFYKKPSGKISVSYTDAVEEALCFGWIDGKIKRINDDYYIQWFTPRRRGSRWSKLNVKRFQELMGKGLVKPSGLKAYEEALNNPALVYDNRPLEIPDIPEDLLNELKNNSLALENFMNFPDSSRRMYIYWLNDAKREDTRHKRILKIAERAEKNIKSVMM
jgi:uncharacterized protein YdeI (YjbR/CyaY-like superfamily)